MFNFSKQSKALILIINDYEVQLFVWLDKTLSHESKFSFSQEDISQFDEDLTRYGNFPVIILTDFIEESFQHEVIAHVSGTDRKAILERKLNYAFRNTPYRIAKITGREDGARRDDKVLLSALTKPELLNPWVNTLLDHNIPIQSITSVAYLMEEFAKSREVADHEHLLLVSLEKGSELRQTYMKKGKILFSRLTSLASRELSGLGDNIYHESLQIRQYLERIKLLPYESPLKVQVFSPFTSDQLQIGARSTEQNSFETFNTRELAAPYSLDLGKLELGPIVLFLVNTLDKKQVENTYATPGFRRYHHLNTLSRTLVLSSIALVIISIGISIPTFLSTLDNWNQQSQEVVRTAPLLAEYSVLTQSFPETPIPSKEMALVVETYEKIKEQSYTPTNVMSVISEALTFSPDLRINRIEWILQQQAPNPGIFNARYNPLPGDSPDNLYSYAILEGRTGLMVTINGFAFSPRSYRQAQDQVQTFSEALNRIAGVSVVSAKMPTDVRLDTSVTTTVGDNELQAPFTLELTLEPTL